AVAVFHGGPAALPVGGRELPLRGEDVAAHRQHQATDHPWNERLFSTGAHGNLLSVSARSASAVCPGGQKPCQGVQDETPEFDAVCAGKRPPAGTTTGNAPV